MNKFISHTFTFNVHFSICAVTLVLFLCFDAKSKGREKLKSSGFLMSALQPRPEAQDLHRLVDVPVTTFTLWEFPSVQLYAKAIEHGRHFNEAEHEISTCIELLGWKQKSETRMTASVLKQHQSTERLQITLFIRTKHSQVQRRDSTETTSITQPKTDTEVFYISFFIVYLLSVVSAWKKGAYPENSRVVFCPNK